MAMKAKHAFGSESKISEALAAGKIDAYDILFLDEKKVGWVNKNHEIVIAEPDLSGVEAEIATKANASDVAALETELATKASAEEVESLGAEVATKVDAATVQDMIEKHSAAVIEVVEF